MVYGLSMTSCDLERSNSWP